MSYHQLRARRRDGNEALAAQSVPAIDAPEQKPGKERHRRARQAGFDEPRPERRGPHDGKADRSAKAGRATCSSGDFDGRGSRFPVHDRDRGGKS